MRSLTVSSHFQKQLKKLPSQDQSRVLEALRNFLSALKTGQIPSGYGFKKINGDKYEIRVDIRKRIAMKLEGDTFVCHVIGDHEEIARYLRDYRNK